MMPAPNSPETAFIVRFPAPGGGTAGLGALVHGWHVITCAHVVNTALGLAPDSQKHPGTGTPVTVEFPFLPESAGGPLGLPGKVAAWVPPPTGTAWGDDLALLVFDRDPPGGAAPARLSVELPRSDLPVRVFGYPQSPRRPNGSWVSASVRGTIGNGRLQLDSDPDSAVRIQPGFSGSPVYDEQARRVVGIIAEAPRAAPDSYAISADKIQLVWPEFLDIVHPQNREKLTILHVSGVRFTGEPDSERPFFGPLHRDIADLRERHNVRPDLLVVTGNLTSRGRPSEFRQATRFLTALANEAGIPRRHVAIVPGGQDVNRQACAAYFAAAEANEEEPVPPFWPKWQHYATAIGGFYDGTTATSDFTADKPFTLFEMPELNVVVAGLNSTMADSHLDSGRRGHLGENQIEWFRERLADYQRRGWLRVAAVHDGGPDDSAGLYRALGASQLAHLFLCDADAGTLPRDLPPETLALAADGLRYQALSVRPAAVTRHARRYAAGEDRWTGDTSTGSGGNARLPHRLVHADAVFPSPAAPDPLPEPVQPARRNEFLERVAEATQVRFPNAAVSDFPRENYLRVSVRHDGGGLEQWPVGVIDGPPSEEAVDAFARGVHASFTSADRSVRSELVYNAPAASRGLAEYARGQGIRLKSMTEYQGLLDLTPLIAAQRKRLASDRLYPAELYVEQRYRIMHPGPDDAVQTGLVSRAVRWLETENARLIMVLGDSGRGKTSFLRQLTRRLPVLLPGVTPVLVELRGLEKGPTLDDLLAQYLIRHDIEDLSQAKLRYMVDSGRLALLFDGFDELELRIGYSNAADYLRKLISSVSVEGRAKVILTSRTQHFRSTEQVLTALGEQVESRTTSRVVLLEDFSDEQMIQFLAGMYGGDEDRARERLRLVRDVGNLRDLAHNPRMLSFIARMDPGDLRAAPDGSGRVNPAQLYEQIINSWLAIETGRHRHEHGRPALTREERLDACIALAQRLWQSPDPGLAMADLSAELTDTLAALTERDFTEEQATHVIAAGSLLVRDEDDAFAFIHQSIMEWLVAKAAARDLTVLSRKEITRLTARFTIDLAGPDAVLDWARKTLADPSAPAPARKNAYALAEQLGSEAQHAISDALAPTRADGVRLSSLDLRGGDLSGHDLTSADLHGADLADMRLDNTNLTRADLSGADLTGVTMVGGSLRDATLSGSRWDHAAILGTEGVPPADRSPELAAAAIPGRDPAEVTFLPPGERHDVAFSPGGSLLAIARGHTVQLIDTASDTTVRVIHGHTLQVTGVAFSPDGTLLATASRDSTARVWNLPSGAMRCTLTGHDGWVTSVAFSPDGRAVATTSRDGTARTWDSRSGAGRVVFAGHSDSVEAVAFSPDSRLLATASSDATARTWNAASGKPRHVLAGHGRGVTSVAFSPDSALLATGSADLTVRIWDAASGTTRSMIAEYPEAVSAVAFSPDGALLATAHGTRVDTLDPASGIRQATPFRERSLVTGAAFSPDGTLLAVASADRAHIWDLESGARRITNTRSTAPVTSIAFSPDGTLLAVADSTGAARAWDTRTGERRAAFTAPQSQPVTSVAFSPDGSRLAAASPDGTILLRETATGAQDSRHMRDYPAAVSFSPDGARLTAGSLDGSVRYWNIGAAGGNRLPFETSVAIAFSADGAFFAAATASGTSVLLRVRDWSTVATVETHSGAFHDVSAAAVSPGGAYLAIGSQDGTARIWDAKTGNQAAVLTGHALPVNSVAFSSDAALVITGSDDGTARIWNARTGRERAVLAGHSDRVRTVVFSGDGALAATGASDGTARIWNAGSGDPVATLITLPGGGYATLLPGGGYKIDGDADDIWWAVKLRRFAPGELDPHVPGLRRLDPGTKIR